MTVLATKARGALGQDRLPLDFHPEGRGGSGPERTPARRPGGACSDGDRLTLETRISGVWEGLLAAGAAECPLCHARMQLRDGAGRCGGCGTSLH
jgi:hypothetical protein